MNLPDGLVNDAKRVAAREGRTFTSLVEESLRAWLSTSRRSASTVVLPAWGEPGARGFLVDVADRDALWDALDSPGHGA